MLVLIMEQFDASLLKLPPLLRQLEHHEARSFSAEALHWLDEVCGMAEEHHLIIAADLALVRTELLLFTPHTVSDPSRKSTKRQQIQRHTIDCLNRAHDLILKCFAPLRQMYQECEPLCRQALAIAAAKGQLTAKDTVEKAMACLRTDADLIPVWTQLVGKLDAINVRILTDRTIAQIE